MPQRSPAESHPSAMVGDAPSFPDEQIADATQEPADDIEDASMASFPASDPPASRRGALIPHEQHIFTPIS